jgi:hypothetical protein
MNNGLIPYYSPYSVVGVYEPAAVAFVDIPIDRTKITILEYALTATLINPLDMRANLDGLNRYGFHATTMSDSVLAPLNSDGAANFMVGQLTPNGVGMNTGELKIVCPAPTRLTVAFHTQAHEGIAAGDTRYAWWGAGLYMGAANITTVRLFVAAGTISGKIWKFELIKETV